jgi:hypothetical protein
MYIEEIQGPFPRPPCLRMFQGQKEVIRERKEQPQDKQLYNIEYDICMLGGNPHPHSDFCQISPVPEQFGTRIGSSCSGTRLGPVVPVPFLGYRTGSVIGIFSSSTGLTGGRAVWHSGI